MDSLQKLVNALMLSAIKKRAEAIKFVAGDPMKVFFVIDGQSVEEMQPPGKLSGPIMALLCQLSGATIVSSGQFLVLVGADEAEHPFEATLAPDRSTMTIVPL